MKVNTQAEMVFTLTMTLTEEQARAVHALSKESPIRTTSHLVDTIPDFKKYRDGMVSYLKEAETQLGCQLRRVDDSRAVFAGEKVATGHPVMNAVAE